MADEEVESFSCVGLNSMADEVVERVIFLTMLFALSFQE